MCIMLILIGITIVFTIIGIVFRNDWEHEAILMSGFIGSVISWLIVIICGFCIVADSASADIAYNKNLVLYNNYTTIIENHNEDLDAVYCEAANFNAEMESYREYSNSKWTSWFFPDIYRDIEPIEVD